MSRTCLITLFSLPLVTMADPGAEKTKSLDFRRDVLPVLSSHCFHCHGPDEHSREAKLRLDVREDAIKESDGIQAIVPGNAEKSEVFARITTEDEDDIMPPKKQDKPLTKAEVDVLKRWIESGANYDMHWAFVAPKRSPIPALPAGMIARNPIDHFIAQGLVGAKLEQSPEADRNILLRRMALDLTGLPPSMAEIEAFEKDKAPDAIEKAADRLMASPAFGEKWARMWMDLARYADSSGYGSDFFRPNIWPYRDWVISAFNRNMPYDEFTVQQLAGDLLPHASLDQIAATAFHRNTMTQNEGGTVDEEYRVAAVKDRVGTTMQVWMGLTANCAQCHSHKFDPISQKEYYQLFAIFNQTEDADRQDEAPKMPVYAKADSEARRKIEGEIAGLEARLKQNTPEIEKEFLEWAANASQLVQWRGLPESVRQSLAMALANRNAAQNEMLKAFWRANSPRTAEIRKQIEAKRGEIAKFKPIELPIMRELAANKRRKSHILTKGNYLAPADEVQAALPVSFGPVPEVKPGQMVDRLLLSRWILDPANPLTARVTVNRFWSQIFGIGLVETEEDFGTQGQFPSHPELLDWLAVTFKSPKNSDPAQLGLGWDVKALLKLIVTSQTYRQSSRVSDAAAATDARNRMLSHYPRKRLDAEAIRDQALALSGLLSKKIGGPSVYPPQPDGLWNVAFNGGQNGYPTSKGEDRYRRGLYTFWRRTAPNPTMTTFDAPSRETCTIRRIPTNTPLQAFVTLNDPVFVECSQALARRIQTEAKGDVDSRLRWALQLVLARPATDAQVAALKELHDSELVVYQQDAEAAKKMASSSETPLPAGTDVAELAAWTVVANILLNLDGVLMKS